MTRDEVIAKWNSMQPRERDAWVAESVFGHEVTDDRHWIYIGNRAARQSIPAYTTDIGTAWEVTQKYPIMALARSQIFEISPVEYSCTFWNEADAEPIEVLASTAQEAVCLAALITVLTQGEGIENNG